MAYDDAGYRPSHHSSSGGGHHSSRGGYDDEYDDRRDRAGFDYPPPADNSSLSRRDPLPAAYLGEDDGREPSIRSSARSRRDRSRSRSSTPPPPRHKGGRDGSGGGGRGNGPTRKGDILSAVGGALVATAADKYLIEPRMKKGGHGRSKSHHEGIRRAADIGIGGIAGTAIYRAVSRTRARKKGALADSRPGSPDDRGRGRSDSRGRGRGSDRDGSRSRSRSRSKSVPWKGLLSTAAGGIAGLAAEQIRKRSGSRKAARNRDRDYSDSDSDDSRRSRRSGRSSSHRRHRSNDRDDRRRPRRDYSDSGSDRDDYDRRDRRRRRDRDDRNPHQARDMIQEAIGLLGTARGLTGKNKGRAAVETAIGAAGLAHNYYANRKANGQPLAPNFGHIHMPK